MTDSMLAEEAETVGLRLGAWLNDSRTWAYLTPADSPIRRHNTLRLPVLDRHCCARVVHRGR
jgi:hypothetical protein